MSYEFYNPTRVLFGAGQLNHLHEQKMPGKKAMLVISNGKSTRASGALDRTMKELSLAGVEVVLFDKVGANPVKEIVEEGGHFAKKEGCDFIVALGGGSVMDAAKVMAMYAQQPGDLWDYVAGATGKQQPLVNPVLPVIAITTTAGTGSEVDQWGVVTNPATNEKIGDMPRKPMDKKAVEMLRQMPWTGNIRELRNVIERLVVLSGTKITPNDVELYC